MRLSHTVKWKKVRCFLHKRTDWKLHFMLGYGGMLVSDMWNMHCILLATCLKIFSGSVYFLKGSCFCLLYDTVKRSLLWNIVFKLCVLMRRGVQLLFEGIRLCK